MSFLRIMISLLYHSDNANVVADAFSRKAESIGSLSFIPVEERTLAIDVQALENRLRRLDGVLRSSSVIPGGFRAFR